MADIVMPVWATDPETINITENAVESLKGHRLIIVDNGSTVGGGQLREWADVYVRNKENLGYAKACNQGLALAGDIVALANNDIRVSPNWDMPLPDGVGTLHFRMIPYDQSFNPGTELSLKGRERWCSGSFFIMRNLWRFDEALLNSYDDWDLQLRVRKDGFHTAYTNKVEYQHLDSYTQQKVVKRDENNLRNREYFKQKHGEYPETIWERDYASQYQVQWKPFP